MSLLRLEFCESVLSLGLPVSLPVSFGLPVLFCLVVARVVVAFQFRRAELGASSVTTFGNLCDEPRHGVVCAQIVMVEVETVFCVPSSSHQVLICTM